MSLLLMQCQQLTNTTQTLYQPGVRSALEQLCKIPSEVFFVLILSTMTYAISCLLSEGIKILPWIYLIK